MSKSLKNYRNILVIVATLFATCLVNQTSIAKDTKSLVLQSTTSTQNSGLLDFILPKFKTQTGIEIRVVAVGTGQALKNARNGDGDILLVHSKNDEEAFVNEGYGVKRFDVMYNDFVIVGPRTDPANISSADNVVQAMQNIAEKQALFLSRGDDSGTHKKELRLWSEAGQSVRPSGDKWYRETGSGMGATLNIAAEIGAYTLTDRATWISFGNKFDHEILFEGDPTLFNQYGVILVNPKRHPHINEKAGQEFIDWLTFGPGQQEIANYQVNGQQLFYPNAQKF